MRWLLLVLTLGLSGCGQLGYMSQSLGGHLRLISAAKPVDDWLAQPDLKPALRERLILSQRLRDFAVQALQLPDNRSYRRYADLQRPAAVWNVAATGALDLHLKTWCFPVMGCVGYRGYFEAAQAEAFTAELRTNEVDVYVYPVPAYSTLGWTSDPLLNTFINWPEGQLARMIFHELAHQVAYAKDDTAFNEAYATAVERLGSAQWLSGDAHAAARAALARTDERNARWQALTAAARGELAALYASSRSKDEKLAGKARILTALRTEGTALGFDPAWLAGLNNASLAMQAAYNDLVPAFEALFARLGSDWVRFHAEVQRLAVLPAPERRAALQNGALP
ncbi:MAG TPA: aminopeptidase [Burkholderiaceae bacterium]